jgi:aminoglycoside 6-adenylyltransferase
VLEFLEDRIKTWAETQPAIRAILVIGSQARQDHPGDQWADLDLMVFATDTAEYLASTEWLNAIGRTWVVISHQTGDGHPERLVLFEDGYKVDFVFHLVEELEWLAQVSSLPSVYRRGYYVLVDKEGLAGRIPPPTFDAPPGQPPDEEAFRLVIEEFWYTALYVAKQIRRRELWIAKYRDWTMKEKLLKMLEWHARAINGWHYDTWHDGRFLLEWTDPQSQQALYQVFGGLDAVDCWHALLASMDLFRRLAGEAASSLGYDYPAGLDGQVTDLVKTLYKADDLLA